MKTTPDQQRLHWFAISSLLAALLIGGCDRSQVGTEEQTGDDTAADTRAMDDEDTVQNPVARDKKHDDYTQQVQQPDRDMSIVKNDSDARPMAQFAMIETAVAEIKPTEGYEAKGEVTFTPNEDNTQMNIHIVLSGLTPGKHGLHIHQIGDCSANDASSAGDHLNPYNTRHGSPQDPTHHVGDLGNIEADANSRVDTTITVAELAFSGPASVLQKAVIVHADEDDLRSDPAGNSGDRVGCGIVQLKQEVLVDSLEDEDSNPQ